MKLIAHLINIEGTRIEQTLKEHCFNTAKYASESLGTLGLTDTAYLAGLLHDMGKATKKFNSYIERAYQGEEVIRGSVNHTFAGVIYLLEKYHQNPEEKWNCLSSEIISYAIGAHHGLFDCVDLDGNNGFLHRLQKNKQELEYEEALQNYFRDVVSEDKIKEYFCLAAQEIQCFFEKSKDCYSKSDAVCFQVGLLSRLILSAVIYGDRRDTSEFMNQITGGFSFEFDWGKQREFAETKMARFGCLTPINQVRNLISQKALEFAERPSGIYRLNVPTGAGKTLSTLRYALAHAEKFQKKHIIFIIPLLSVLDQNAKVIRQYIKDNDLILEHHSNVFHEKQQDEELDWYELLSQHWNAPIIISTLVQLLNILFSHQTSAINRMQALCNSVVIIDEVQSLPKKMILMFNMAMNFLSQCCNTTVLLSSATQPCFEEVKWPILYASEPDMVQLSKKQFQIFERSQIVDNTSQYGMDLDSFTEFCVSLMEKHNALLVICNTKKEARDLYEKTVKIADLNDWKMFHLSTSMCQSHRLNELAVLQKELVMLQLKLAKKEKTAKIVCIATQLVEAGVDFSFDGVVRVLAGIDNLAQAAGRCNRSNEYSNLGKVYLVNLKDENITMLPEILAAQDSTLATIYDWRHSEEVSLIAEPMTRKFYQKLFQSSYTKKVMGYPIKETGNTLYLADFLANKNPYAKGKQENRQFILHQPFKTVGREFKVFEENTIDILVPYEAGKQIIEKIISMVENEHNLFMLQELRKQMKKYTISIYQWQKKKLFDAGLLISCLGGRVFVLNEKAYHEKYGLNDIEEQAVEDFII